MYPIYNYTTLMMRSQSSLLYKYRLYSLYLYNNDDRDLIINVVYLYIGYITLKA